MVVGFWIYYCLVDLILDGYHFGMIYPLIFDMDILNFSLNFNAYLLEHYELILVRIPDIFFGDIHPIISGVSLL